MTTHKLSGGVFADDRGFLRFVNDFDFSKNVMIKNKAYRVNKIDYKPNDLSTVEFILIG